MNQADDFDGERKYNESLTNSTNEVNGAETIPEDDSKSALNSHLGNGLTVIRRCRFFCGAVVNHESVQLFIVCLIFINALMMGAATFDFVDSTPSVAEGFEIVDLVFLIIFTAELILQFIFHGLKLFLDGWLIFDLIVIVTSWSFASLQIVRAFRIFRTLRLVTRVKVMKNLVLAVFSVLPRMSAIGLLLLLIFYIFAVMMTQFFRDLYAEGKTDYDYFSSLHVTLFTLFQMMTLDNWASISRQVVDVVAWAWIPLVAFVITSGFIVVNLIIAVICDAVSSLNDDVKAKILGTFEEEHVHLAPEDNVSVQLETLERKINELSTSQEQLICLVKRLSSRRQRITPKNND
jgi:Ion transport protein